VVAALGQHLSLGHLTMDEFESRLDTVYTAGTHRELDAALVDLPTEGVATDAPSATSAEAQSGSAVDTRGVEAVGSVGTDRHDLPRDLSHLPLAKPAPTIARPVPQHSTKRPGYRPIHQPSPACYAGASAGHHAAGAAEAGLGELAPDGSDRGPFRCGHHDGLTRPRLADLVHADPRRALRPRLT